MTCLVENSSRHRGFSIAMIMLDFSIASKNHSWSQALCAQLHYLPSALIYYTTCIYPFNNCFPITVYIYICPLGIKQGVLENHPFIEHVAIQTSIWLGHFPAFPLSLAYHQRLNISAAFVPFATTGASRPSWRRFQLVAVNV